MPHIHTEPGQVDTTVTMYLFRERNGALETMLHMHKKAKILMAIGGHVELDETIWQAVAHELEEESGYELSNVKLLQPKLRLRSAEGTIVHPQPMAVHIHETHRSQPNHFHSDLTYAFLVDGEPTKQLGEDESSDLRWLSLAELDALNDTESPQNVREAARFIMETFSEWELIDPMEYSLEKKRGV